MMMMMMMMMMTPLVTIDAASATVATHAITVALALPPRALLPGYHRPH